MPDHGTERTDPLRDEFVERTDPFRRELLAYCYRMLASHHDAEDVLQDVYLRAWRSWDAFEGRSSVRTWLYRIATNACLNALDGAVRRVLPSGLGAASDDPLAELAARRPEVPWLEPLPDPADATERRDGLRLAFVAALQTLPATQRAVLVLRDVLAWSAAEVADLLDTSPAAVNSALQRARATVDRSERSEEDVVVLPSTDERVVARFVEAFEAADLAAFVSLLRADVRLEMPPFPTWFRGREAVAAFYGRRALRCGRRCIVVRANGCPAVAAYQLDESGVLRAHSIQVLDIADGEVAHIHAFIDAGQFAAFGLPTTL